MITKEDVLDVFKEHMSIEMDQVDVDLNLLGMDSLCFIKIIVDVESKYGVMFPDEKLTVAEMNTFDKVYEILISINSHGSGE